MRLHLTVIAVCLMGMVACGETSSEATDGKNESISPGGKADSVYDACINDQVLAYVNAPDTDYDKLRNDGINSRAAENIIAYRDGADETPGTEDDNLFDSLAELDSVYWVGPVTMGQLADACAHLCEVSSQVFVIFSPQEYENSHLAKVHEAIDGANRSIDIAMYSFRDSNVLNALGDAIERGVKVRFIFETANKDRKEPEGSWSAKLEERGINVRYINKIMHHKFAIIDGPIGSTDEAYTGTLITGSGNWSNSAAIRYDENTTFITGSGELLLRFQKEFNHVWANSRDFIWDAELPYDFTLDISDWIIPDDPHVDAVFTSANFSTKVTSYGPTFSVVAGMNTASDRLVELINNSSKSIYVASGHLRSRPVSEALMAKAAANPTMDIRVLLDNQEYISSWYADEQLKDLGNCLNNAGDSESKKQKCFDKGFYFSQPLYEAGIPLKFKYYCYRWHYSYAPQMHNKYMIFDEASVASGSYNLSDNAEHNTLENIVIYNAASHPQLIESFKANFNYLWTMGDADGLYAKLLDEIENGTGSVPLVFEAMALTYQEVTVLKDLIKKHCPHINDNDYKANPKHHTWCPRD